MAHRGDYTDVINAIRSATKVIEQIGISNFKLSEIGCVHFCSQCGAELRTFYGSNGGALRDDAYVNEMRQST